MRDREPEEVPLNLANKMHSCFVALSGWEVAALCMCRMLSLFDCCWESKPLSKDQLLLRGNEKRHCGFDSLDIAAKEDLDQTDIQPSANKFHTACSRHLQVCYSKKTYHMLYGASKWLLHFKVRSNLDTILPLTTEQGDEHKSTPSCR